MRYVSSSLSSPECHANRPCHSVSVSNGAIHNHSPDNRHRWERKNCSDFGQTGSTIDNLLPDISRENIQKNPEPNGWNYKFGFVIKMSDLTISTAYRLVGMRMNMSNAIR